MALLMKVDLNIPEAKENLKNKFKNFILDQYRESFMTDEFVHIFVSRNVETDFIELTPEAVPQLNDIPCINGSSDGFVLFPQIKVYFESLSQESFFPRLKSFFDRFVLTRKQNIDLFPIRVFSEERQMWNLGCNWLAFL